MLSFFYEWLKTILGHHNPLQAFIALMRFVGFYRLRSIIRADVGAIRLQARKRRAICLYGYEHPPAFSVGFFLFGFTS